MDPSINAVISYANKIENNISDARETSFNYIINSRGPNIEPWGTPCEIGLVSDWTLLYETYCSRLFK